ncbi:MAG: BMP family ABC transporter substrate-binding protein [bacterium]
MRGRLSALVAGLAAVTLALSGCGSKKDTSSAGGSTAASGSGSSSAAANAIKACMVTDTGGIDDKSFNASAYAGLKQAADEGKATVPQPLESKTETDYKTNISNLLGQSCKVVLTVGGLMGPATKAAADANPNQKFVEVDNPGNGKNWQGLQFDAAQGGFLGGYLAAGYSKTGVVATYGGLQIPPVTVYMDGFWEGVQYFNQQKGKSVKVLGWDESTQKGTFGGGFVDQNKGKSLTSNFIAQNADVIFPVAGGLGLGSAGVAQSTKKAVVIWVDTDGYISAPQYKDVFISTVFKDVKGAVYTAISDQAASKDTSKDYIGTLANNGTGLSPFHDFDSKVDSGLKGELDQIKQDIVSGKITLKSKASPK